MAGVAPLNVIDAHTHIFPPEVARQREQYLARDSWFGTLYANPRAKLASAEDLIESMDRAGIQTSWVLSFGWRDPAIGRDHNAYLLDAAARYPTRLLPFAHVAPGTPDPDLRGFAGIGEWMPEGQGFALDDHAKLADQLASAAVNALPVLLHASEPVGHQYPGKSNISPASIWRLARAFPHNRFVAAHWGGGLPFYELMPEVRRDLANVWYDTAAGRLLYDDQVFRTVLGVVGATKVLWASDYPVLSQRRYLRAVDQLDLPDQTRQRILGANALAALAAHADAGTPEDVLQSTAGPTN